MVPLQQPPLLLDANDTTQQQNHDQPHFLHRKSATTNGGTTAAAADECAADVGRPAAATAAVCCSILILIVSSGGNHHRATNERRKKTEDANGRNRMMNPNEPENSAVNASTNDGDNAVDGRHRQRRSAADGNGTATAACAAAQQQHKTTFASNRPPMSDLANNNQQTAAARECPPLDRVPPEMLVAIFRHLSHHDLLRAENVCLQWRCLIRRHIWPLQQQCVHFTAQEQPEFVRDFLTARGHFARELHFDSAKHFVGDNDNNSAVACQLRAMLMAGGGSSRLQRVQIAQLSGEQRAAILAQLMMMPATANDVN